mmetsp:Transcript_4549/g.9899  ORF Transcript_4549/g.9899 Transcript_4549/m.9899 type:complete len:279 (-) Transcript_4549:165-1001(-)
MRWPSTWNRTRSDCSKSVAAAWSRTCASVAVDGKRQTCVSCVPASTHATAMKACCGGASCTGVGVAGPDCGGVARVTGSIHLDTLSKPSPSSQRSGAPTRSMNHSTHWSCFDIGAPPLLPHASLAGAGAADPACVHVAEHTLAVLPLTRLLSEPCRREAFCIRTHSVPPPCAQAGAAVSGRLFCREEVCGRWQRGSGRPAASKLPDIVAVASSSPWAAGGGACAGAAWPQTPLRGWRPRCRKSGGAAVRVRFAPPADARFLGSRCIPSRDFLNAENLE